MSLIQHLFSTCIALVFVVLPAFAAAQESPQIFEATYKGEFSGWKIEMVRSLTHFGNDKYRFTSHADNLFASLTEESIFTLANGALTPENYVYARKIFGKQKKEQINFDWKKHQAVFSRNDKNDAPHKHTLAGDELDPALYHLALQRNLYLGIKSFNFNFIKRNKLKTYKFIDMGLEKIKIEGKRYTAQKLKRAENEGDETLVWLIPDLDYQIGKIVHNDEDGSTYEIELISYKRDLKALEDFYRRQEEKASTSANAELDNASKTSD